MSGVEPLDAGLPLAEGSVIAGKYRLLRPLARGGMGAVWLARHQDLDVDVAVKVIAPEALLSNSALVRFRQEARASAQLRSPHIIQILDYGVSDQLPYIAMELLEGRDLANLLEERGRLSFEEVVGLLGQVCKALKLAHDARIVHRDLKPSNVFLTRVGDEHIVKVLDFGIAKVLQPEGGLSQTASATLVGSPLYMSPEQSRGDPVDLRTDVWSLSVMAFELLAGRPPFEGRGLGDLFAQICQNDPPSITALGVDVPGLDAFFRKGLAKEPSERHQTVGEWLREFGSLGGPSAQSEEASPVEIAPRADAKTGVATQPDSRPAKGGGRLPLVLGLLGGLGIGFVVLVSTLRETEQLASSAEPVPSAPASASPKGGQAPDIVATTIASPPASVAPTASASATTASSPGPAAGATTRPPVARPGAAPPPSSTATAGKPADDIFGIPHKR